MTKIPVISGLRGLAICGVIFHHLYFGNFQYGLHEPSLVLQLIKSFLSSGWLGVNLFFLLSGLVLYWPYACGKRAFLDAGSVGDFYVRRFFRLFPLYWFICLVSLVFVSGIPVSESSFLRWFAALMTVTFPFSAGSFVPKPNWVLWSLGVEILFSLLLPFLALAIRRFGWHRVILSVALMSLSTRVAGQLVYSGAPMGYLLNVLSDSVLGRLDEFMLGMLLAHLLVSPDRRSLFSASRAALGGFAILCAMYAWGAWLRLEIPGWSAAMIAFPLDLGMFFVVGYLSSTDSSSIARKLFQLWPLQMLGLMCYSIYLWHGIVMVSLSVQGKGYVSHLLYLALVILLSGFTYRYIEFGREQDVRNLLPSQGDRLV